MNLDKVPEGVLSLQEVSCLALQASVQKCLGLNSVGCVAVSHRGVVAENTTHLEIRERAKEDLIK